MLQLLDAYTLLHGDGRTAHRDVKPENVLIATRAYPTSGGPHIKLCDFAFSKAFSENDHSSIMHTRVQPCTPLQYANFLHSPLRSTNGVRTVLGAT